MTTFVEPEVEEFTFVEPQVPCEITLIDDTPCPRPADYDVIVTCVKDHLMTRHVCSVDVSSIANGEVICVHCWDSNYSVVTCILIASHLR